MSVYNFFLQNFKILKNYKRKARKICVVVGCVWRSQGAENNTGQSRHLRLLNPVWLTQEEMPFCNLTYVRYFGEEEKRTAELG